MIAILRYNAGNSASVRYAVERLGYACTVTDDPKVIRMAEKVIFPGVGAAGTAMQYLKSKELDKVICSLTQPVLGICLGLQLLCAHSDEDDTPCLGIFDAKVKRFPPKGLVPHTGWNQIHLLDRHAPLLQNISNNHYFYFVHSYYAEINQCTSATTDYLISFSAVMEKDNFFATQFHPEKSASPGALILSNFLKL